ncbi:hypothetical protein Gotri_001102 [Gossypium trilobum]|uniref:Uncharacterized protein n=1 Tax=Gossypium trilobum TaxID=34281 RepID=A0A7J9FDI2_9ROSI|nr:hypothetical protein [Gossypium trilobum]
MKLTSLNKRLERRFQRVHMKPETRSQIQRELSAML